MPPFFFRGLAPSGSVGAILKQCCACTSETYKVLNDCVRENVVQAVFVQNFHGRTHDVNMQKKNELISCPESLNADGSTR